VFQSVEFLHAGVPYSQCALPKFVKRGKLVVAYRPNAYFLAEPAVTKAIILIFLQPTASTLRKTDWQKA
jgi:hypothetical protein